MFLRARNKALIKQKPNSAFSAELGFVFEHLTFKNILLTAQTSRFHTVKFWGSKDFTL